MKVWFLHNIFHYFFKTGIVSEICAWCVFMVDAYICRQDGVFFFSLISKLNFWKSEWKNTPSSWWHKRKMTDIWQVTDGRSQITAQEEPVGSLCNSAEVMHVLELMDITPSRRHLTRVIIILSLQRVGLVMSSSMQTVLWKECSRVAGAVSKDQNYKTVIEKSAAFHATVSSVRVKPLPGWKWCIICGDCHIFQKHAV